MASAAKAFVQKAAPFFSGPAWHKSFKQISLTDYKNKYLVFFFYPFDFTFVCPTEIIQFSDMTPAFNKLNCEVLGCSTDSHFSHMEWDKKPREIGGLGGIQYPLLSDYTKSIARDYGVLIQESGAALRGTFIIDKAQNIRHIGINDLSVGRNVEEVLRMVEAFQYADEHGEVCPAQWKKGSKTMVADHSSSKTQEYFKSLQAKK